MTNSDEQKAEPLRVLPYSGAGTICETRDKTLLARLFDTDRPLYAYLLGDLDPFFFVNTRWWVASESSEISLPVEAALLRYDAFETPVFIGLAENDAQAALWENALEKPPECAHIHYRKQHKHLFVGAGEFETLGTYYKMVWNPNHAQLDMAEIDLSEVMTLSPNDIECIRELHKCAAPGSYFDERLLKTGLCFGIWRGETLVAFSGCHVYSRGHSVAALGAIATHPQYCRRGLGAKVTLRLLYKLRNHIDCICLNVHSDNAAALTIYKRLGFGIHCEYQEAILRN